MCVRKCNICESLTKIEKRAKTCKILHFLSYLWYNIKYKEKHQIYHKASVFKGFVHISDCQNLVQVKV